ncbi:MAG: RNA-binding S4 domain-containing protein [Rhodospirillales bacterium]
MDTRRLDKWLWYARFFKSRSLATRFCASGRLRVNGAVVSKAHYGLRVGDVLTFPKGRDVRVVKVLELGRRRGPAAEAQALYDDLEPPRPRARDAPPPAERRDRGQGRPTKRERRETDRLKGGAG